MKWIAIDPSVLLDAMEDRGSEIFIEWVLRNAAALTIIVDRKGELLDEYIQFQQEQLDQGHDGTTRPYPALELVNSLTSGDGMISLFDKINPWREAEWQEISGRRQCSEHTEQLLIGLAHDAFRNWGRQSTILLIEEKPGARHRGLWKRNRREQYEKEIGLLIQTPKDIEPFLPRIFEIDVEKGHWFEDKVKLVLQHIYPTYNFRIKTPAVVENLDGVGQIDIWATYDSEELHSVLLGECKLRKYSNTNIEDFVIRNQLRKKIDAVLDFEFKRQADRKPPIELKLFVASNAPGMTDSAWKASHELIKDYEAVRASFSFLEIALTEGWEQQDAWEILRVKEWQLDTAGNNVCPTHLREIDCTNM